jgi:hypothetical protein
MKINSKDGNVRAVALQIDNVKTVLEKYYKCENEIVSYSATDIGAGVGFSSFMIRISFVWKNMNAKFPQSIIVKISSSHQYDENAKEEYANGACGEQKIGAAFGKVLSQFIPEVSV